MGKVKLKIISRNPKMLVAFLLAIFAIGYLTAFVSAWFLLLILLLPVEVKTK